MGRSESGEFTVVIIYPERSLPDRFTKIFLGGGFPDWITGGALVRPISGGFESQSLAVVQLHFGCQRC